MASMHIFRSPGVPGAGLTLVEQTVCAGCNHQFSIFAEAGELPSQASIEQARIKLRETCGAHPGDQIIPY
jgi:hypothetical protein